MVRLRGGVAVAAAALLLTAVSGCELDTEGSSGPEGSSGGGGAVLAAAEALPVKGRAPKTGYDRDRFGSPWADTDSNKCGTRVISMIRRVTEIFVQLKPGVVSCAY